MLQICDLTRPGQRPGELILLAYDDVTTLNSYPCTGISYAVVFTNIHLVGVRMEARVWIWVAGLGFVSSGCWVWFVGSGFLVMRVEFVGFVFVGWCFLAFLLL